MPVRMRKRNIAFVVSIFVIFALGAILLKSDKSGLNTRKVESHPTRKVESFSKIPAPKSSSKSPPSHLAPGPVLQVPKLLNNFTKRVYDVKGMVFQAAELNFEQNIRNTEKFGEHKHDDPIIIVQTHDRDIFLKLLIDSLKTVKGIESATLVISRDKFTREMDHVIDNEIDFCRYVEIFFPFSMQLYPDTFPGEDPNDCPRDLSKTEARKRGCNNAECPDMYGHYREVKFVQLKHHWFWKLNMVFGGIRELSGKNSPILLLEDDNYVVPDLIHVMKRMRELRKSSCPDCLAITLGAYDATTDYKKLGGYADVTSWISSQHNIGMVVEQDFFDKLSTCAEFFCKYDDYNWDWSLQATALKCIPSHLYTMVMKVPRVYHLGCTGFHQKSGGRCDVDAEVKRLSTMIESEDGFFPQNMEIISTRKSPNPAHTENGGWGDIRDHELCQKYLKLSRNYLQKNTL